jgi:hypothetical protein
MSSTYRLFPFVCAALLWLFGVAGASAQFLVYELRFTPEAESVNFSFYTGGYIVVPAQGGAATIVLTTEEEGRFYAVAESSGKYFVAANANVRKAVFAAGAVTASSQSFYTASGPMNRSLLLRSEGTERSWRVAESLTGRLMTADDESLSGPAPDGSFGVIGSAVIQATLREDLTGNASAAFKTQNAATAYLVELLEKYGYAPDEGSLAGPVITPEEAAVIDASLFPVETRGQAPATAND